jgi:hypothetical protein
MTDGTDWWKTTEIVASGGGGGSADKIVSLSLATTTGSFTTTAVTCVFDTTEYNSGAGDFTISGGVVTCVVAGTYDLSYDCSTDQTAGNNRSTVRSFLLLDGTTEISGTSAFSYSRSSASGAGTGSCIGVIKTLTVGQTVEMQAIKHDGGAITFTFLGGGCRLKIRKIVT